MLGYPAHRPLPGWIFWDYCRDSSICSSELSFPTSLVLCPFGLKLVRQGLLSNLLCVWLERIFHCLMLALENIILHFHVHMRVYIETWVFHGDFLSWWPCEAIGHPSYSLKELKRPIYLGLRFSIFFPNHILPFIIEGLNCTWPIKQS